MALTNTFLPWKMGGLSLDNRLVRSATVEGLSTDDGAPTQRLIDLTAELAKGEVGLIISGTAFISEQARGDNNASGLHHDGLIHPWSKLTEAVHSQGGKIAAQLLHCGSTPNPALLPEKTALWGPVEAIDPVNNQLVKPMGLAQIVGMLGDYAQAARRAKEAGFDAVQIHAAHGYLLNQFISPNRNTRTDSYGGSTQNRARLLYEVYDAIRMEVGKDYPVFVKLSGYDGFDEGLQPDEAAEIAAGLDLRGINAIEVSAGTQEAALKGGWDHILKAPFEEGINQQTALKIKAAVKCPVIVVEGWRDPVKIDTALEELDAIAMSRPFIREPHLANRWREGDLEPAKCVSCNECLKLIADPKIGLSCVFSHLGENSG